MGEENDPTDPQNKYPAREAEDQLRRLLMDWDPIGVAELPNTADEYDCLLNPVMHQLKAGASAAQLRDWLCRELVEHFGLTADPSRELKVASEICSWWDNRSFEMKARLSPPSTMS